MADRGEADEKPWGGLSLADLGFALPPARPIGEAVITAGEARALIAAMVALSVIIAAYGYYQVMVSLPADRAAYAANPEEVLQRTLGHAFPPGSPERKQFEDRLQSTEPLATFDLANCRHQVVQVVLAAL